MHQLSFFLSFFKHFFFVLAHHHSPTAERLVLTDREQAVLLAGGRTLVQSARGNLMASRKAGECSTEVDCVIEAKCTSLLTFEEDIPPERGLIRHVGWHRESPIAWLIFRLFVSSGLKFVTN